MTKTEKILFKILTYIIALSVVLMLTSLGTGFLDYFMPGTWHGRVGFDFFSVPRSFINLSAGRSIYDTWSVDFGPYATWFPYHPLLSVTVGAFFSLFSPWHSYIAFVLFSLALLFCGARCLAANFTDALFKRLVYFLVICSPVVYMMLWNGQMHVFVVLAACMVLADMFKLLRDPQADPPVRRLLFYGVLICMFSKPVLLLALPALFAVKNYRRTLLFALAVYVGVSVLFVFVPFLNPMGVGLDRLLEAAANPSIIFDIKRHAGGIAVSYSREFALDNAIHWLNMRNLFSVVRDWNFEFFSLSSLLSYQFGHVPAFILKLPVLLLLACSGLVYFIKENAARLKAAICAVLLSLCTFYLGYDSVYEYHYAALLPAVVGGLFMFLHDRRYATLWRIYMGAAVFLYLPTPYIMVRNPAFGFHHWFTASMPITAIQTYLSGNPYGCWLTMLRVFRVVPVAVMFAVLVYLLAVRFKHQRTIHGH